MKSSFPNIQNYFSYYHLTLSLEGTERYMGRINPLQVIELCCDANHDGITHYVRFYDGANHSESSSYRNCGFLGPESDHLSSVEHVLAMKF